MCELISVREGRRYTCSRRTLIKGPYLSRQSACPRCEIPRGIVFSLSDSVPLIHTEFQDEPTEWKLLS